MPDPSAPPMTGKPPVLRLVSVARLALVLGLSLAAILVVAQAVWRASVDVGLAQVAVNGRADLRLAADRLVAEMARFREVSTLAAEHPQVQALADGQGTRAEVAAVLQRMADISGAEALLLVARDGRVLAGPANAPERLAPDAALLRAAHGAAGTDHGVDAVSGRRYFTFAAPVFAEAGPTLGAVVLRIDAERVEAPGRGNPVPVWFTDASGVVFIANRSEMLFATTAEGALDPGRYPPDTALRPMQLRHERLAGLSVVRGGGFLPELGLPVALAIPVIGMTGHALADVSGIVRVARVQALSVAVALIGFGAIILALWERRRALFERLAAEARANAALEERVSERTAALQEANERLTRTQAELVQAGKLSALGQMSAGISHELNQPLMAISSYAENAELFITRGRPKDAALNLEKISEMARRMGRIIRNLRAFARAESEPATRVGLASVVESALDLMQGRIERSGAVVDWRRPEGPAIVMGGEVRLSQVVVNLISNALDAMEESPNKIITLRVRPKGAQVHLTVADTGPGIADPGRIFDPFYSTKEVGSAEGMGLGLSISYGLVQGFGGTLSGENLPEGGAVFTVMLRAAQSPGKGAA